MGECRKVTQHTGLVCRGTSSPKREGCGFSASEIEFSHYMLTRSVSPIEYFLQIPCVLPVHLELFLVSVSEIRAHFICKTDFEKFTANIYRDILYF